MIFNERKLQNGANVTFYVSDGLGEATALLNSYGSLTANGAPITKAESSLRLKSPAKIVYQLTNALSSTRAMSVKGITLGTVTSAGDSLSTEIEVNNGDSVTVRFVSSVSRKWLLNETLVLRKSQSFDVEFSSGGNSYNRIIMSIGELKYRFGTISIPVYAKTKWANESYRSLVFVDEPSGDLLTWLQANGVPQ